MESDIKQALEALVRGTYQLWDEEWVGFTWRTYTFEHVRRVRALARALAAREGADERIVDWAGLLHDITKGYDGEIITRDGRPLLGEDGYWRNQTLAPARHNLVTDLYRSLGMEGRLHSESGAAVAEALLLRHGVDQSLAAKVATVIRSHLRCPTDASLEEQVLYDADTIDANIGLPAFHRNLYIVLHREETQRRSRGEELSTWVDERRAEFLRWYLGERVPAWIGGKRQDFLGRLITGAGKAVAEERFDRLVEIVAGMRADLATGDGCCERGGLAVMGYLIEDRRSPRLSAQLAVLAPWAEEKKDGPAIALVKALRNEMDGVW